jgi:hypothetical protein
MQTYRKIISDIISDLRAYSLDDRFSYRFILHKLQDGAEYVFSQDADARKILKSNDIYKAVDRFDLCPVDYGDNDLQLTIPIQKSVLPVPATFNTNYGNLLKILSPLNNIEYKLIQFNQFKDIQRREISNKKMKYAWIESGYLYVPDSSIQFVKLLGVFKDSLYIDYINGKIDKDYKPLDSSLTLPDKTIKVIKDITVQSLAEVAKRVIVDENPNLNNNIK